MPVRIAAYGVSILFLLAACRSSPSDADRREIGRLQAVRDTLRLQADSIGKNSSVSRESLLGAIQAMRLQLLRTTDDLLRQRSEALAAGADFHYVEPAFRPDRARADSLARAISATRDSLAIARRRAASVSAGGLVGALMQVQVETQALTIDMLEMTRLAALYGIGLPQLKADSTAGFRNPR